MVSTMTDSITASEALYGFTAWLSCRKENITLGQSQNPIVIPPLIAAYCKANDLNAPRNNYAEHLIIPPQQSSDLL